MPSCVLFLCTGNYYRSRFAEILFNALAERQGLDWRAESRGLKIGWPGNVGPIAPAILGALQSRNILCPTVERHPLECVELDLLAANLVIALKETEHRPLLEARFPV